MQLSDYLAHFCRKFCLMKDLSFLIDFLYDLVLVVLVDFLLELLLII